MTATTKQVLCASRHPTIRPARQGPPPEQRLPPTPQEDDGNYWVTGRCWLWCGRVSARVLWLGPATVAGTTVGIYACEACTAVLANEIVSERLGLDMEWGLNGRFPHGPPAGTPTGRHRRVL